MFGSTDPVKSIGDIRSETIDANTNLEALIKRVEQTNALLLVLIAVTQCTDPVAFARGLQPIIGEITSILDGRDL